MGLSVQKIHVHLRHPLTLELCWFPPAFASPIAVKVKVVMIGSPLGCCLVVSLAKGEGL